MSDFAVDAASALFQAVPRNKAKPYLLTFSNKSTATDISTDANKFANQLVDQINQSFGTDASNKTVNIDEFTQFASGKKFKKFSDVKDPGQKAVIQSTFNEISGNRSQATVANMADYVRGRDSKDGKTDGQGVLNFLI